MRGNVRRSRARQIRLLAAGLAGAAAGLAAPRAAQACGGCFNRGAAAPVVAHRMAFAISEARTVLWDQFDFTGEPEEFSWVLPIHPGAYLELAGDAWFDALEATTSVTVQPPPLNCASRGPSGCGSERGNVLAFDGLDSDGVQVVRHESVGPYDTVTLRSDSGDALTTWLVQYGFLVPPDVVPIIAAYVSEHQDFIALKLLPTAGVSQMKPVRVVTPKGPPILPLRMVAAGAAASLDIVLYVIGNQRFGMPDFSEVQVDPSSVRYDFNTSTSNYPELRTTALSFNGGQSFLTAFAAEGFFVSSENSRPGGPPGFVSRYLLALNGNRPSGRNSCASLHENTRDDRLVVPDCENAANCDLPNDSQIPASEFECEQSDDLSAALIGQHPSQAWLTRLELRLPRTALTADCVIQPAADPTPVSNQVQAAQYSNPPCDLPVFSSSISPARPRAVGAWLLAAALAGVVLRRSGRRRG